MPGADQALKRIKEKAGAIRREQVANRSARLIVGTATCGVSAGANDVVETLEQEIQARGVPNAIVTETGCSGRCDLEPLVQVVVDGEAPVLYYHVTPDKARRIVQQHIQNGEPVREWIVT